MGLMKLLGTSASFARILDRPSRYRVGQLSLLPKFGADQRPEVPAVQPSPGSPFALDAQSAPSRSVTVATKGRLGDKIRKIFRRSNNKTMNTVEADPSVASASAPSKPEHAFPFGRWTLFRSPFNRVTAAAPESPSDASPVQGELLLDAVKPVRNDLSDSDLEVIETLSPNPGKAAVCLAVPIAGDSEAPLPVPAWRRVSAQFSGAEKP